MKLSTKTSILKSTVVEIVSPRLLDSPRIENDYIRKNLLPKAPELSLFSMSEGNLILELAREKENRARAEAERLVFDARVRAEEILQTAVKENVKMREDLKKEVRDEVFPVAQSEGYNRGLEEGKAEAEKMRDQAKAYLELAETALMDELKKNDKEIACLCIQICEKILHASLKVDPEILLNNIRSLAIMPQDKEGIRIHLSDKDWEWFKDLPGEDKPPYPVIVDESLKQGDIFLECSEGIIDAGIRSQLEKIGDYLAEEFKRARLDGFGEKN